LFALENPTGIDASLAITIGKARSIADEAPGYGELAVLVEGRNRMARCQSHELCAPFIEQFAGTDQKRVCSKLQQLHERSIDLGFVAGIQDVNLYPNRACRFVHLSGLAVGSGIALINERSDDLRCRDQVVQQPNSFRHQFGSWLGYASDVAGRPTKAADEAERDRVTRRLEDDWNVGGRGFGCEGCGRTRRSEHSHPAAYQIGDHLRQSFVVTVGPPIFDRYVLTFYISGVSQTLTKRARKTGGFR